jgi:site-specific DNA-cytosine methylase
MPTVVSLFSGCGGSDAGVLRAGFEVLMANDILPYARDVYLLTIQKPTTFWGMFPLLNRFLLPICLLDATLAKVLAKAGFEKPIEKSTPSI